MRASVIWGKPLDLDYGAFLAEDANFTPPDRVVAIDAKGLPPGALKAGLYEPEGPVRGVVVFHHGGGGSRTGYGGLANLLRRLAPVAVLTPDLRGHGDSAGPRGYAPTPEAVWADVDATVAWSRRTYPDARLMVGGHSSGGGLVVNWAARRPGGSADLAGLVLLAPLLSSSPTSFAKARLGVILIYLFSGRRLMARAEAVRFRLPAAAAADTSRVDSYTPGMALAVTPRNAAAAIANIACPMLLLAADDDELFDMDAMRVAAGKAHFDIVPGTHLSCLLPAAPRMAAFMRDAVRGRAV